MPHLLIIGAGPGIAAATARRFQRDGYDVALVARRAGPLAELGESLRDGGNVGWATADSADAAALTEVIGRFVRHAGPVDVLLYNVSVGRQAELTELTADDFAADLAAGALGLQTAIRAVLPGMRERGAGTVLVTGSVAAERPNPGLPTLGVQKAAVRVLVLLHAKVLAPLGIHVATATIRGLVGEGKQIEPDRIAALYAELVAETPGPAEHWRTEVDVRP